MRYDFLGKPQRPPDSTIQTGWANHDLQRKPVPSAFRSPKPACVARMSAQARAGTAAAAWSMPFQWLM
jgi:hypothetical protein